VTTLTTSPHTLYSNNVTRMMLLVVAALLPGFAAHGYFFGYGILLNSVICVLTALLCEAAMLKLRARPLWPFLTDGSAIVTALLIAVGLPSLFPWWLAVVATAFAIVIAKQLYGGLGNNPFNPAMIGYVLLLIAFPKEMTFWFAPHAGAPALDFMQTLQFNLFGQLPATFNVDALTTATPLATLKAELSAGHAVERIISDHAHLNGAMFGRGWDTINSLFLFGGLFLLYKRVITWRIPVSMIITIAVMATLAYLSDNATHTHPVFQILGGATMVGAFFIATDPVTASTTPRGQLIYGCGIGIFTYIIRNYGGYPDGVAFAVLLMNLAAPTIDHYTRPRVFGHGGDDA
jgi:electron transport complex protein RnfD